MAIAIQNDDLSILLTENSVTTTIWKDNARVLAFGDVVRITDRDGIRYEFLYTDVISPVESSAADLADTINNYLITIVGGGGGGSGTVTSVGLSVPAPVNPAFTVSGSPVTTSGTMQIVAAGTVDDYVRGDGSLKSFPAGSFGVNVGNGQTIVQPGQSGYWTAPCDGTIADWVIQSNSASGTVQFDVWKASGSLPTVSDSIVGAGTKPYLSSERYRTEAADFDTLSFSQGDVFGFYVEPGASNLVWAALQIIYTKS